MSYYGVEKVEELGKPYQLDYFTQQKLTTTGKHDVEKNKRLVMVLDNDIYKVATDVTDPAQLKDFLDQYRSGHWLRYNLYKLDVDKLAQCPDKGRLYNPKLGPR